MLENLLLTASKITIPIVFVIVPALLFLKEKKRFAIYSISLFIVGVAVYSLKFLFQVPRPHGSVLWTPFPRFPSGHAAFSFLLVGYFKKIKYRLPLIGFAVLASYSRIYFNVHEPVDIVVGGIIGFLVPSLLLWKEETITQEIQRLFFSR